MGDEVGECLVHQPVGECRGVLRLAQLEQEALAQVAGPDAGRVELLDDREHLLEVGHGVEELGGRSAHEGRTGVCLALQQHGVGVGASSSTSTNSSSPSSSSVLPPLRAS